MALCMFCALLVFCTFHLLPQHMLLEDVVRVVRGFLVSDVPVIVPVDMLLEIVNGVYGVLCVYSVATIRGILLLVHSKMPINLSGVRLRNQGCAASIEYGIRPGEARLENLGTYGIWDCMMPPIVDPQEATLRAKEREGLILHLPRYSAFMLLLGMVRPMQVDRVGYRKELLYLAQFLFRGQYCNLHKQWSLPSHSEGGARAVPCHGAATEGVSCHTGPPLCRVV